MRESVGGLGLTSIESVVAGYLAHVSIERGLSVNTVAAYRRDLGRYAQWCQARGIGSIEEVHESDVSAFAASLSHPQGELSALSASSAARCVVAVRNLHAFAELEGLTLINPAIDVHPPMIPKRLPKALPYDEVERLIEAAGDLETEVGVRDRAMVELLYGTGTRVSEVTGLDLDDIDLANRTILVTGKGSKQRLLPLGEHAATAIEAYLVRARPGLAVKGKGSPRLFLNTLGRPLSRQSAYGVLVQAAQRAGVKSTVSPHSLRHSFATHLLQNGADIRVVQELLGHASVTTTQIYTLVTADTLRDVYLTSHPRAR